jgi:hypothetical protein
MDDRKNKQVMELEATAGDFAAAALEFCDASVLVGVSHPEGAKERTMRFVAIRGNPYVSRELVDLHLDGRLSSGATWVGPAGTLPARDVYEDPEDPDGPAVWPSPFADALAQAFLRFVQGSAGQLSAATFLGSCGAGPVPGATGAVSFSAGNPLAASGALAEWRMNQDE